MGKVLDFSLDFVLQGVFRPPVLEKGGRERLPIDLGSCVIPVIIEVCSEAAEKGN